MAWGSSSKVDVKSSSAGRQLIPLIIAFIILGGMAFVGYQIYLGVSKIKNNTEQRMAKHNMVFTKDGMKVGVRHVEQEKYVDRTQNWVVKAWNMAESSTDPSSAPAAAAAKRRSARNAKPASAAAESAGNGGAKKR